MKKKFFVAIISCIILIALLTACNKKDEVNNWGSNCTIYLKNLPIEYEMLADEIRDRIEIRVSLRNISTNKKTKALLTEENNYQHTLNITPGTYEISNIYIDNKRLTMFDVEVRLKSIQVAKDSKIKLPVFLTDPLGFAEAMKMNQASDEILKENIFSRKVQYCGQIIDLDNVKKEMKFSTINNKWLKSAETFAIDSTSHAGVAMIVQNKTSNSINVNEATLVGFRFYNNNVVLPKGILIGMNISEIMHSKKGILGTPDYCRGSAFIGIEFGDTTIAYIDKLRGDKISFTVSAGNNFISVIDYEFEKYE